LAAFRIQINDSTWWILTFKECILKITGKNSVLQIAVVQAQSSRLDPTITRPLANVVSSVVDTLRSVSHTPTRVPTLVQKKKRPCDFHTPGLTAEQSRDNTNGINALY
jgi:hypothetical protein